MDTFRAEFAALWRTERKGILYQASLFEDRGTRLPPNRHSTSSSTISGMKCWASPASKPIAASRVLPANADFETITDPDRRAACESKALKFGRHLAVNRQRIHSLRDIRETVERLEKEIPA